MSTIDTNKLIADLLAMHDMPLRPDAADKRTLKDAMEVISGQVHRIAQLEKDLREAMQYIGEVPHHVFTSPKEVVAFYERNFRLVTVRGVQ